MINPQVVSAGSRRYFPFYRGHCIVTGSSASVFWSRVSPRSISCSLSGKAESLQHFHNQCIIIIVNINVAEAGEVSVSS